MGNRNVAIKCTCKHCGKIFYSKSCVVPHVCSTKCASGYRCTILRAKTKNRLIQMQPRVCPYCQKEFISYEPRQKYCTSTCKQLAHKDKAHFNWLRRTTIGLEKKECWVCGKLNVKHLHAHHVMGHKIAPEPLIGLCPGCHRLASMLGNRNLLEDEHKVADLITIARFIKGLPDAATVVKYIRRA